MEEKLLKKTYEPPTLTVLGDVEKITEFVSGEPGDGGQGSTLG